MRLLFVDKTTKLDSLSDYDEKGRGGMVTSLHTVPTALSKLGHTCYVLSDIKQGGMTSDGVLWIESDNMTEHEKNLEYDFLVLNRQTLNGLPEIKAKHRILWTHDLPHHGFIPDPQTANALSGVVFMSDYAERVWREYYKTIGRSFLIPNGVDKSVFYPREKNLNEAIFFSAPNRGLKYLPLIYRTIKNKIPDFNLIAFSSMAHLHPDPNPKSDGFFGGTEWDDDYKECIDAGIDLRDPVPQKELAGFVGSAGMMIMPTVYPETCSNVILQSLASGVPVITTGGIGYVEEWVKQGKNGFLTKFQQHDYYVWQLEITRYALDLLNNQKKHKRLIKNVSNTYIPSWKEIGEQWNKMLNKLY